MNLDYGTSYFICIGWHTFRWEKVRIALLTRGCCKYYLIWLSRQALQYFLMSCKGNRAYALLWINCLEKLFNLHLNENLIIFRFTIALQNFFCELRIKRDTLVYRLSESIHCNGGMDGSNWLRRLLLLTLYLKSRKKLHSSANNIAI